MTFTTRPELSGRFGMVASTHWLASGAGMGVLERGGNAFDAAVGGRASCCRSSSRTSTARAATCRWSRGRPRAASRSWSAGRASSPARRERRRCCATSSGSTSCRAPGLLPACVPGAFDGWMLMLLEHGTLAAGATCSSPRSATPRPGSRCSTRIARHDRGRRGAVPRRSGRARPRIWLPARRRRARGCATEPLAATYRRLVAEAEAATERPRRPDRSTRATRGCAAGSPRRSSASCAAPRCSTRRARRHRGLLTEADLAGWRATFEAPATLDYRGVTVCKTGPWGQGPVLLQQLALLDGLDVAGAARRRRLRAHDRRGEQARASPTARPATATPARRRRSADAARRRRTPPSAAR